MSELARRLNAVDPKLTVISGHRRRKHQSNFDRPGPLCPKCNGETMRFLNGLCPRCANEQHLKNVGDMEDKAERQYYREELRKGTISLSQMKKGLLQDTPQ